MILLFVYLFIALFISFLCSIMEAILLSSPISFLKAKVEAGHKSAELMVKLKSEIDQPLSAILSLNTIAHTVGAAGVGAQATAVFGEAYFGIISAVLTLLILILSEIIPKTIGARFWRQLVFFVGPLIRFTIFITYPLVVLSAYVTRLFTSSKTENTTSREELSMLAQIGMDEGVVGEKENRIIQNMLKLKAIKVSEIMTPRVVVSMADEDMTLKSFSSNKNFKKFSRIPLYREKHDNITGYVVRQSVFEELANEQPARVLKDIKREIVVIPNASSIFQAWETLLENKEHMALVVDEYGGMDGIVTLEDIIETLLGIEIMDEKDTVMDMRAYARHRWEMRQKRYQN